MEILRKTLLEASTGTCEGGQWVGTIQKEKELGFVTFDQGFRRGVFIKESGGLEKRDISRDKKEMMESIGKRNIEEDQGSSNKY